MPYSLNAMLAERKRLSASLTDRRTSANHSSLVKRRACEVDAEIDAGGAIHIGEPNLKQDLRFDWGDLDAQQINGLAQRGSNRHYTVGGNHVLYSAAYEGGIVVDCDIHIAAG